MMNAFKSFLQPQTNNQSINHAALILRIAFGLLMMRYGWMKIENYSEWAPGFMNFLWLGGYLSLGLVIFAEFFCALFVILGAGTRLALIPLMITMLVALFVVHWSDPFDQQEHPLIFLVTYLSLMILGPGKYSVDALLFRKRKKG